MNQYVSAMRRDVVTSLDVAAAASVSQSTVSKALRGEPGIKLETRMRVVSAARELGYYVDARASNLRRLKADCIAVVLVCNRPGLISEELHEGSFLLPQVQEAISALGYEMLLSIQCASEPHDNFVSRRRAETTIVIGRRATLEEWRSGMDRESEVRFFAFSPNEAGHWVHQCNFRRWLADAIRTGQTACEIQIAEPEIAET